MNELFRFISRSRAFILFAILEIFALWCVYRFNNYGSAILFNTTSLLTAKSVEAQNSVIRYTKLNTVNEQLVNENTRLNKLIATLQNKIPLKDTLSKTDSSMASRFDVTYAEAINYSTNQRNNFITINKGELDGIEVGMGVISATGIVGKVKVVKEHMALVTSILHSENLVSSQLKKSGKLGTVKWEGVNPNEVALLYIDKFQTVQKGDTVLTSPLNSIFPAGIMVGTVKIKKEDKNNQFLGLTLQLSTDFKNLAYVYVIKNKLIKEQTELESNITQPK
jgi:rod shape-determining protein MreC